MLFKYQQLLRHTAPDVKICMKSILKTLYKNAFLETLFAIDQYTVIPPSPYSTSQKFGHIFPFNLTSYMFRFFIECEVNIDITPI